MFLFPLKYFNKKIRGNKHVVVEWSSCQKFISFFNYFLWELFYIGINKELRKPYNLYRKYKLFGGGRFFKTMKLICRCTGWRPQMNCVLMKNINPYALCNTQIKLLVVEVCKNARSLHFFSLCYVFIKKISIIQI